MHPVQALLRLLDWLDAHGLSPGAFANSCAASGWPEPTGDSIGLWEVNAPVAVTSVILDTLIEPTTLICRLECDDAYEPDALREGPLRQRFDSAFTESLRVLSAHFPKAPTRGRYAAPYDWQFAHFEGLNSVVALEQTHYDEVMGVQLLLLLQQGAAPSGSAITAAW